MTGLLNGQIYITGPRRKALELALALFWTAQSDILHLKKKKKKNKTAARESNLCLLVLFFRHHSHSPLTREQSRLCTALGPLGILTFCSFSLEYCSPPFLRRGSLSLPASRRGPSGRLPLSPTLTACLSVSPARLGPPRQSQSLVCPLLNPSRKQSQVGQL